MKKSLVIFSKNWDKKTANMIVDNFIISDAIPYIPSLAVDHRGLTLYYFAKENSLSLEDFFLDEETEAPSEVLRGYNYMSHPKHVAEEIALLLSAPFRRVYGK